MELEPSVSMETTHPLKSIDVSTVSWVFGLAVKRTSWSSASAKALSVKPNVSSVCIPTMPNPVVSARNVRVRNLSPQLTRSRTSSNGPVELTLQQYVNHRQVTT